MRRGLPVLRAAASSLWVWLVVVALLALTFVGGRYSVGAMSSATAAPSADRLPDVWTVHEERIGRTLTFVGDLSLDSRPGPVTGADGIITGVSVRNGQPVRADQELFQVNLQPVVAGQGAVPAFRDLTRGVRGADVIQLRRLLCATGHLRPCSTSSPTYSAAVEVAVKAWQKSHHAAPTGQVKASDILWFERLPVTVRPARETVTGARLSGGERPLDVASGVPRVRLEASRDQAALVPVGALASVAPHTKGRVTGTSAIDSSEDAVTVDLAGPTGVRGICAASRECRDLLGGRASTKIEIAIQAVAARSGPGVPVRAIQTAADDTTYVVREDRKRAPVHVLGSSQGVAVVTGVAVGDRIQVNPS